METEGTLQRARAAAAHELDIRLPMYETEEDTAPFATRSLDFAARSRWNPKSRKRLLALALLLCVGIVGIGLIVAASKGGAGKQNPPSLRWTGCVTPYGSEVGFVDGVPAFSNCNDTYVSDEGNFENFGNRELTFTGMKWQCVEYARRYLMVTKGVQFDSVDGASDIWALNEVTSVNESAPQSYTLKSFANGLTRDPPSVGDMLIYPIQPPDMPYGYVAIIVALEASGHLPGYVRLAEQNWFNAAWKGTYARQLDLKGMYANGNYTIVDSPYKILGWQRVLK